ncbi:type I secretion membrane fusion protein, HlyD family [Desulfurobacterium thermolithotrophum DSM 11699]|uniref:Type I secretion membrane fusion protein, HlyD family n=1 Tax=Desulfurobacterium thermolithotrophum (strain DSM 11699 / BSA) TaxID=868864 RepID=F0S179_DESTD|nr:HlyD family type I secretion periplasmic adaptor subunit [Desulfurobacterium thermolithotrophum]ADY73957.1 type I secretion membrane fusion protein, HlyD family [Desulfurobacterium thermolithotrophum DSM 11699]
MSSEEVKNEEKNKVENKEKIEEKNKVKVDLDDKKYITFGSLVVFLIFGLLIGWAALAKIDTVVVAPGKVVVKSYKKPVQHKDWGTVTRIFVKEGDFVKKGDPLLELEKLEQDTNYKVLESNYYNLLAERDRLLSEKKGLNHIAFSSEFLQFKNKKLKEQIIRTQRELFFKRKRKLQSELAVLSERENQAKEQLKGLKSVLKIKENLLNSYIKEIKEQEELVKEKLVSKIRLLDLMKEKERLEAEIKDIKSKIPQVLSQIEELNHQKTLQIENYQNEVASKLDEVLSKLSELKPKVIYAKEKVKKTIITANTSGQVLGLKIHAKGEVVKPGDTLMYIVPKKDEIFILAKVLPQDRDRVSKGQLVDLHFPAFLSIAANIVEGKVTYVATDTLFDQATRHDYYETHIVLTDKGKEQLKKYGFNLVPGMPAVAYIKVEKVTPLEYVLQPVLMLVKTAFKAN